MDPATIAMALAAFGKLFQGFTGFLGGHAEAKINEQMAQTRLKEGTIGANIALEEGDRVAARAAVSAAASGGGGLAAGGSAGAVLEDLARQSMFNARNRIYEGVSEAKALRYKASVARTEGNQALISSVVDAGSTWLGEAGKRAQQQGAAGYGRSGPAVDPLATAGAYGRGY